jgi:hypothetical protein
VRLRRTKRSTVSRPSGVGANRAAWPATIANGRRDRIAAFRDQAGTGGYETSLRGTADARPQDRIAIQNWRLAEASGARPTCFSCRAQFSPGRRPGAFLTQTASRAPKAGIAVAGICLECWNNKTPEEIEAAALAALRRNLGTGGFAD